MSHALETLDRRPHRFADSRHDEIGHPKLHRDHLTQCASEIALDMVTEPVVFFAAPTTPLVSVNRAAAECLGYSLPQLQRLSLLDIALDTDGGVLAESIRRLTRGDLVECCVRTAYRHRSGALISVNCSIRLLRKLPDSLFVAVGQPVALSNKLKTQQLDNAARDHLTLLPDRTSLWCQLEREVRRAQQSDYHFAVLFVDVDRFKDVNDSFGHLAGDQVLQAVARRLTAVVRPNDEVVRYGGDEFVVLMKDVRGPNEVRRIAERIGRRVNAAGTGHGGKGWRARVTVSIGAALIGGQRSSAAEAVDRADQAMYRAKARGRNGRFVIDRFPKTFKGMQEIARELVIEQNKSNELDK